VTVTVQAEGGDQGALPLTVLGPNAAFQTFPATPIAGQPVQFVYTPTEPIEAIGWDLNGDGVFDDGTGQIATTTFAQPGVHAVSLQVSDIQEPPARSTTTQLVRVVAPAGPVRAGAAAARLMSPFPVVRITGKVSRKGALIKRLSVRAPYGSTVSVRCRGRGCPFRRATRTLALAGRAKTPSKTVTIRKLARRLLRGGASVKVLVTRQGEIGKYTRFKIRRGKAPLRTDLCLAPGSTAPSECPNS
jgi:PKD repeat protein